MKMQIEESAEQPLPWWIRTAYTRLPSQVARFLDRIPVVVFFAFVIGCIAFIIDVRHSTRNSLWFDESYSVNIALQPLSILWSYIWGHEAHTGLYYILLRAWVGLASLAGFHPTEVVVRLPSILSATLSAVIVFLIGWRFWGKMTGIVASLTFIFSFVVLMEAQLTRSYAFQGLLVCLSWYTLLVALTESSKRSKQWWIAYTICASLAVYAQIFSVLLLAAQVIAYIGFMVLPCRWRSFARQSWRTMAASLVCIAALISPVTFDALIHGGANSWVPVATPRSIHDLFFNMSGNLDLLMRLYLAVCALGVAVAILSGIPATRALLARFAFGQDSPAFLRGPLLAGPKPGILAPVCWLLIPIILAYIATQQYLNEHLFLSRYLMVIAPAYCLFIGIGVSVIRLRFVGVIVAIVLVYYTVIRAPLAYYYAAPEPWHAPAIWLEQHYQAGDGIICAPDFRCGMSLQYYLQAYPSSAHLDDNSPGNWIWSRVESPPNEVSTQTVTAYAAGHSRIFLVSLLGSQISPNDLRAQLVAQVGSLLGSRYKLVGQYSASSYATTITVSLYELDAPARQVHGASGGSPYTIGVPTTKEQSLQQAFRVSPRATLPSISQRLLGNITFPASGEVRGYPCYSLSSFDPLSAVTRAAIVWATGSGIASPPAIVRPSSSCKSNALAML